MRKHIYNMERRHWQTITEKLTGEERREITGGFRNLDIAAEKVDDRKVK
jgi:hypothetical protein